MDGWMDGWMDGRRVSVSYETTLRVGVSSNTSLHSCIADEHNGQHNEDNECCHPHPHPHPYLELTRPHTRGSCKQSAVCDSTKIAKANVSYLQTVREGREGRRWTGVAWCGWVQGWEGGEGGG